MERLTGKDELGYFAPNGETMNCLKQRGRLVDRLAAYEDTWLTPEQCQNAKTIVESAFADDTSKAERIRELLRADREGRVVVLPCKVGDTVYVSYGEGYRPCVVDRIHVLSKNEAQIRARYLATETLLISASEFGKTVFLTLEEAKEALEVMKNG